MAKSLEEIKKLWESETDEWIRKAVTENINDYPAEVQKIIRAEAIRRVSVRSNPEAASVTVEEVEPFRLKAKTKLRIGLICAFFILLNEAYNYLSRQYLGAPSAELSRYFIKGVVLSIYIIGLLYKKVRLVQFVYSFWLWLVGYEILLVFMLVFSPAKREASLANPIPVLLASAIVIIPYLMGIYVLRLGFRGLRKLTENQET